MQKIRLFGMVIVLAISMILSGCGTTQKETGSTGKQEAKEEVKTEDSVSLVIWDEYVAEPQNGAFDKIIDQFEAEHPNVIVKRNSMDHAVMRDTLKTAISGNSGPDIFLIGPGWGGVGPLIEANAIYDLTEAYEEKGWTQEVLPWARDYVSYGKKVWSLPWEGEAQGVFYHKDIFEENEIEIPETYDEFIAVAKQLNATGKYESAIATAARPAYAIGWMESAFLGGTVPDDVLRSIVFEHQSWNHPEYLGAIESINELYEENIIPKDVLSYSYDDMTMLFYSKMTPMIVVGSWIIPEVTENFPDLEVGFFPVPAEPDVESRAPKAVGGAFHISNTSENIEASVEFLDFLVKSDAGQIWLEDGKLIPPLAKVEISNLTGEEFTSLQREVMTVISSPISAYNLYGVLPSGVNDATWNGIQKMWTGKLTPQELVDIKDELWQKAIEEGRVFK